MDLDQAAELLRDLPALWELPGVTQEQRWELAREVFDEIRIREGKFVAVKPRPDHARSPPTYILASGIVVPAIGDWLDRFLNAA